jgi:hypothetical protein
MIAAAMNDFGISIATHFPPTAHTAAILISALLCSFCHRPISFGPLLDVTHALPPGRADTVIVRACRPHAL